MNTPTSTPTLPSSPTETRTRSTYRRGGIVGPLILIGAGIVLLLNNFGILSWDIWEALFRLWPIILIAIGLDVIVGRQSIWGSLLVAVVFLALLFGGLYFLGSGAASGQPVTTETFTQDLSGATRAQIELRPGLANLRLATASNASALLAGNLALDANQRVTRDFQVSGDTATLTLREVSSGVFFFPFGPSNRVWDLRLARDVPTNLTIRGGVGNAEIDLREANLSALDVNVGVGSTAITLPARGNYSAAIDGGIGNLVVNLPQGLAARINANTGIGGFNVSDQIPRSGSVYQSSDYDTAANRVDLRVSGGIGNVNIQSQITVN